MSHFSVEIPFLVSFSAIITCSCCCWFLGVLAFDSVLASNWNRFCFGSSSQTLPLCCPPSTSATSTTMLAFARSWFGPCTTTNTYTHNTHAHSHTYIHTYTYTQVYDLPSRDRRDRSQTGQMSFANREEAQFVTDLIRRLLDLGSQQHQHHHQQQRSNSNSGRDRDRDRDKAQTSTQTQTQTQRVSPSEIAVITPCKF